MGVSRLILNSAVAAFSLVGPVFAGPEELDRLFERLQVENLVLLL